MQRITRLFTSAIFSCIFMLSLSYFWHGIVLNDIDSLQYDLSLYVWLLFALYLIISLFLSFVISVYVPSDYKFLKHVSIGMFLGFLIYLAVFVLGVSFSGGALNHVIVDFTWQMIEQGLGAGFLSLYYAVIYRLDKLRKFESFK